MSGIWCLANNRNSMYIEKYVIDTLGMSQSYNIVINIVLLCNLKIAA